MDKIAKFNVGDCVIHKQQNYRAVIIDIDPFFQASGTNNPRARSSEFANRNPWYRLLVDESSQMTYVEESLLEKDPSALAINNPQLGLYLCEQEGAYQPTSRRH